MVPQKDFLPPSQLQKICDEEGYHQMISLSPVPAYPKTRQEKIEELKSKVRIGDKMEILTRTGKKVYSIFLDYSGIGNFSELFCIGKKERWGENNEYLLGSDEFTNHYSFAWKIVDKFPWE